MGINDFLTDLLMEKLLQQKEVRNGFFALSGREVIKYHDLENLEVKLRAVFEDKEYVRQTLEAAQEYVATNSAERIAHQFLELFSRINNRMETRTV